VALLDGLHIGRHCRMEHNVPCNAARECPAGWSLWCEQIVNVGPVSFSINIVGLQGCDSCVHDARVIFISELCQPGGFQCLQSISVVGPKHVLCSKLSCIVRMRHLCGQWLQHSTWAQRHDSAEYRPHKHELHCTAPTPNGIAPPARSDNAQTPDTKCWTPGAAAAAVAHPLKITNSI